MMSRLALIFFGCCLAFIGSMGAPMIETEREMMAFLNKYDYLKDSDMVDGLAKNEEVKRTAVMFFQKMGSIPMTGILDDASKTLMNTPRCGMTDMDTFADVMRKKRYSTRDGWGRTDLTWNILTPTNRLPLTNLRTIMDRALKVWSNVSNLEFEEVNRQDPDIKILFARGEHGDGYEARFDGPLNVLAHAYFPSSHPIGGDAHFDDDEDFTDGTFRGTNLFQVAAHEFGHSLGLGHSDVEDALMFAYYRGYQPNFKLHADDIAGIQHLYGEGRGESEMSGRPTPSTPTENCMTRLSFATRTSDGSTYLGNETHVFRRINNTIPVGYPRRIEDEFPGLEPNLDAALFYGSTYFFKGSEYWKYSNRVPLEHGHISALIPDENRRISALYGLTDLPSNIDSAFIWGKTGKIFVTKGDEYYLFYLGYGVLPTYPRPLSNWRGIPSDGVDAALQYTNGMTYFFQGSDYYRFNDTAIRVDNGYPRNTAVVWIGCNPNANVIGGTGGDAALMIPSVVAIAFSVFSALYVS